MSLINFRRNLAKRGKSITLQNRDISEPGAGFVDFDEDFSGGTVVLALVKTVRGRTYFDGVNTETPITHELKIEYLSGVTSETWVLFKGRRLDVLTLTNCCEDDEILILECNERGLSTVEAAKL